MTRIITHQNCTDGFHSAFIAKKYLLPYLKIDSNVQVIALTPTDIELDLFELDKQDIVLDLPKPKRKVYFWADHHPTSKPKLPPPSDTQSNTTDNPTHTEWRNTPSCTGLLIDYLQEKGIALPSEVLELKKIIDKIDTASYTIEEYEQCFMHPNFNNPNLLQQTIILSTVFQTKDANLNTEIFQGLFNLPLAITPLLSSFINTPFVHLIAKAHYQNMQEWRVLMDSNFEQDPKTKTAIQDDRKIKLKKGVPDRFYVSYKFKDSHYGINLREKDIDKIAIGIGKNVFYNKTSLLNVGQLCKKVGQTFGEGSGGGHQDVGGCIVLKDKADIALQYILDEIKQAQQSNQHQE